MFGFGKKKAPEPSTKDLQRAKRSEEFEQRKAQNKAQLGMFMGLETDTQGFGVGGSFDVDDGDIENELLQLIGEEGSKRKGGSPVKRGVKPKGVVNLDFEDAGGESGSGSEEEEGEVDDPELEAELGEILGETKNVKLVSDDEDSSPGSHPPQMMTLLQERLQLYEQAKSVADKAGDAGKLRRFLRGINTLKELQNKAKTGKVIDEAEIPPAVSLGVAGGETNKAPAPPPAPTELSEKIISLPEPPPDDPFAPSPTLAAKFPEPLIPTPVERPVPPPRPKRPVQEIPVFADAQLPPEPPVDYDMSNVLPRASVNEPALERLKEYKRAAIVLKRNMEVGEALKYLKLSKSLEAALNTGEPVDLVFEFPPVSSSEEHEDSIVRPGTSIQASEIQQQPPLDPLPPPVASYPESEDIFHAPPPPGTVLEALEQRLHKYKSEVDKANSTSNASKARRMGRIVKQYEEAVMAYKKGKPVAYEDLPTPPGFAPIPIGSSSVVSPPSLNRIQVQPAVPQPSSSPTGTGEEVSPEKKVKPGPSVSPRPGLSPSGTSTSSINRGAVGGKPVSKLTLQEKQLREVLLRQKQYRDAAVEAKKNGDINQAREYLRISKGFDNLIEASKSGLPVDLKTMPAPPDALISLESEDFELVSDQDCVMPSGNLAEVFAKLEEDLKSQLKMCMRTRDHFKAVGDIASANRFEGMAVDTKRDLDALRLAAKTGKPVPKYHYENRIFSITECNTDLKDDEIEISVLKGINYKTTSSTDTFVRVELPYPSVEEAQSQKSAIIKDAPEPEYNVTYKMSINRSARNFQRFIHRHGVKVEVWSKGGFLRSSSIFGTAVAKLQSLETKNTLHDAFDLLDGRKIVGKIEIKIRLRDPVLTKQLTQRKEKWLSIDRT